MTATIRLSARQRSALRRAIIGHPLWDSYKREQGINAADLSSTRCLEIAARFGIDVRAAIAAADTDTDNADTDTNNADAKDTAMTDTANTAAAASASPDKLQAALTALNALLAPQVDEATIERIVTEKVRAALEGTAFVRIEVQRADSTTYKTEGHTHPLYPTLLKALACRQANGLPVNIWIAGPTGSGKTHAAEQAAKALGVPFYFNGALSMPHELLGFVDAAGQYHTTPFRQAYEHGGVYLFDEVDASDNAALLALNAALANGVCAFPDKAEPVKRHPDFRCIGAANTFGHGATADFVGRAKIDAAFLSRFPVKLHWTYDTTLEQAICGNAAWAKRVQDARARAADAGLKIIIDPRHTMAGAALIAGGMSEDMAAELTYLAGLSPDQRKIVEGR